MGIVLFWVVWGLISFWVLKTFYYSFSKDKLDRLRKSALFINFSVLILAFFPWLSASLEAGPSTLGGKSAIVLAREGNSLAVIFIILIMVPIFIFHLKKEKLYTVGASAVIINTFTLFVLMYQLRPGTYTLSLLDLAPIVAFMSLLVGNVVVLLLWQQLQMKRHKKKLKT